eukprot:CAMPEP_0114603812 /NCGR_PEP_ID=MMETSP0168-20121206/222_1 /TAXON_ID=95228 ORGANISM="Vannella sp., Strain DIVA3 517/6/12" /NCGR_SAMPLE_ID=MMETSP0168 /ASSEMBLY_ACC=CAM_ASM_000044 /LENGTH=453 /DNA_ID=CAMNT_0001814623 /DNA_START=131 /DNA_END=1492 /DNA_ORIENTATION=+
MPRKLMQELPLLSIFAKSPHGMTRAQKAMYFAVTILISMLLSAFMCDMEVATELGCEVQKCHQECDRVWAPFGGCPFYIYDRGTRDISTYYAPVGHHVNQTQRRFCIPGEVTGEEYWKADEWEGEEETMTEGTTGREGDSRGGIEGMVTTIGKGVVSGVATVIGSIGSLVDSSVEFIRTAGEEPMAEEDPMEECMEGPYCVDVVCSTNSSTPVEVGPYFDLLFPPATLTCDYCAPQFLHSSVNSSVSSDATLYTASLCLIEGCDGEGAMAVGVGFFMYVFELLVSVFIIVPITLAAKVAIVLSTSSCFETHCSCLLNCCVRCWCGIAPLSTLLCCVLFFLLVMARLLSGIGHAEFCLEEFFKLWAISLVFECSLCIVVLLWRSRTEALAARAARHGAMEVEMDVIEHGLPHADSIVTVVVDEAKEESKEFASEMAAECMASLTIALVAALCPG